MEKVDYENCCVHHKLQDAEPCFYRSYFNTIPILLIIFGELIDPKVLKEVGQNMSTEKNVHAKLRLFNILELRVGGRVDI